MGQAQSEEALTIDEAQEGGNFRLYVKVPKEKWPILYSSAYDITFGGLERIHPFDSSKWRRVYQLLVEKKMLKGDADVIKPVEISRDELLKVHKQEYIDSLNVSCVTSVFGGDRSPNRACCCCEADTFAFDQSHATKCKAVILCFVSYLCAVSAACSLFAMFIRKF